MRKLLLALLSEMIRYILSAESHPDLKSGAEKKEAVMGKVLQKSRDLGLSGTDPGFETGTFGECISGLIENIVCLFNFFGVFGEKKVED